MPPELVSRIASCKRGFERTVATPVDWGATVQLNAADAKAIAAHHLRNHLGNTPHAGDPVLVDATWRVPIHADFPVPKCTDVLRFRNLGEILIDTGSGEVLSTPTFEERESRMVEEIGRVLGETQNDILVSECERCGVCCGPLGATAMEIAIIDKHVRRNNIEVPEYAETIISPSLISRYTSSVQCPYLKDNACMVYPVRPTVCRLFGTVSTHLFCCVGGRVPEPITHEAASHILRRVSVLNTLWVLTCRHRLEVDV